MNCFVDILTFRAWFLSIFPRLVWWRFQQSVTCYIFRSSPKKLALCQLMGHFLGIRIVQFDFRFVDIKDEQGVSIGRRLMYQDLAEILEDVLDGSLLQCLKKSKHFTGRLPVFINKNIASRGLLDASTTEYALYLIRVMAWLHQKQKEKSNRKQILFLVQRPWLDAIKRYGQKYGVSVNAVSVFWVLRGKDFCKELLQERIFLKLKLLFPKIFSRSLAPLNIRSGKQEQPRLALEYYGQLNFDNPGRHSDLFFWQQSALSEHKLAVVFGHARDPLDDAKWRILKDRGADAIALSARVSTCADVPGFVPPKFQAQLAPWYKHLVLSGLHKGSDAHWVLAQIEAYQNDKYFWQQLFSAHQIQIYVSWFKHSASHSAIADALTELGGISAYYQRSYEEHPSVAMAAGVDIEFGFSPRHAVVEQQSRSKIGYHVSVGFLGDHRAKYLGQEATALRAKLQKNGAQRIIAFFDENTHGDVRWHKGHEYTQFNYAFLLEKLLETPWLGLVLKPKVPVTLRSRLGGVNDILNRAVATGRCHIYEEGILTAAYPPALAALSADLAIHEHLYAATAAIESALAGIPTLLLDRDGWAISSLYQLGVGQVVFNDWPSLWQACCDHWQLADGLPHLGDWSPILPEIDPFRDGRAAERMGTYLKWLLDGFQGGKCREQIMADAAERYGQMWGFDKISSVN